MSKPIFSRHTFIVASLCIFTGLTFTFLMKSLKAQPQEKAFCPYQQSGP